MALGNAGKKFPGKKSEDARFQGPLEALAHSGKLLLCQAPAMPPKAVRKSSDEAPPAKATGAEAPNAWGTRPSPSAPRTAATPTSPSTGPKAKAAANQTSMSIAAQAARRACRTHVR
eukprot:Skav235324  [mRNA]  locus=scaffold520:549840:552713:+ [translate_table: standard]